jgi:2-methylcitrate dehydratase PrpD
MQTKKDDVQTRTERLAEAASRFSRETLPADTLECAKDCLLDHIAVSLYGMRQPWSQFVADMVESDGGAKQSSVYGRRLKVPAQAAALVNGTAAHGFELDDWHAGSLAHLGATVIPAVLAMAERNRLSGNAVLCAIVAGYEVMARAGMSGIPSIIMRGFHPTGTHGPIGAAAGVANLLGLSAAMTTRAIGIGASCAAGLMEFSQDEEGTMIKRMHAGRAAQAGVIACDLAQRGMTSPRASLDGKYGYARAYSDAPNLEALDRDLWADFQIRHNNFKPYACCGMLHAPMDGIVDLMKRHSLAANDVSQVHIGGSHALIEQHDSKTPESVMAAQYSMPYSAAAALVGRAMDPRVFDEGSYQDPGILAEAQKVELEFDPEIEGIFPGKLGASIRLRTRDGRELRTTVHDASGTSGNPFARAGIIEKARVLCEVDMAPAHFERLVEMVMGFDKVADASELLSLLDTAAGTAQGAAKPQRLTA